MGWRHFFIFFKQKFELKEVRGFIYESTELKEDENGITESDTGQVMCKATLIIFHSHKTSVSTLGLEHFIKNKRKQERTREVIANLHWLAC